MLVLQMLGQIVCSHEGGLAMSTLDRGMRTMSFRSSHVTRIIGSAMLCCARERCWTR